MKTNTILLCVICSLLILGLLSCYNSNQTDASRNLEQIDLKRHTMTIEEIDAECRLYRIDITSPEEIEELPYIDYNIKVKLAHLQSSVFKLSKDLIDSIHEEGIVAYTS